MLEGIGYVDVGIVCMEGGIELRGVYCCGWIGNVDILGRKLVIRGSWDGEGGGELGGYFLDIRRRKVREVILR